MIDEENKTGQTETTEQNYIDALAEMRNNTVPKEDYQKVLSENKQLLDAIVNGQNIELQSAEPEVDIDELRKDMLEKNMNNLEYAEKALKLRSELLKRGERDPFVPYGHNYIPDENDIRDANKAADALQHCVDIADGSPEIFLNELQRIMVDVAPIKRR